MPDPFLQYCDFDLEYERCVQAAEFHQASVWRQERHLFLKCEESGGRTFLARIDCNGYPDELPEVTFLNPASKQPTADLTLWPPCLPPIQGPEGLGACVNGTRTYAMHHLESFVKHGICVLVENLILCCRGLPITTKRR